MEAIRSSETSGTTQRTTWRHIPEEDTLQNHHCENLKSYTVNNWLKSNLLSINLPKTHCMEFKTKNLTLTETKIVYNNKEITEVPHTKFLGLEIENALAWNLHIDNVINKLTSVCFMLRSVKPYMTLSSLIMIYYSLFHSMLFYGIIFWGHATNSRKLFILQKRAIRLKTG
jgi:hypothetical protein